MLMGGRWGEEVNKRWSEACFVKFITIISTSHPSRPPYPCADVCGEWHVRCKANCGVRARGAGAKCWHGNENPGTLARGVGRVGAGPELARRAHLGVASSRATQTPTMLEGAPDGDTSIGTLKYLCRRKGHSV